MGKKPELLAPAGGWEQLEYAIRFGADAVYLATDRFGLRQRACNFELGELPAVVAYAHEHGVAVHVTCNAQMHEGDFAELPRYLQAIDAAGVDAVLVSDLGALRCAREHAPNVAIHVSTQASVSNVASALTWHELGASRVVCAREMSLEDIAAMRAALPASMEVEVFVHGAMCMAISGRCLISDYLTGRSATNGNCTQPCRWNYTLEEEKRPGVHFPVEEDERGSYIMNAKDMNMLAHLDALVAAGVDSIKIEGRNKKAFYVATVVNAYRQVLDGADPALFEHELDTVSHRPYGTGFYFGPANQTPESDAYIRPYDWAVEVTGCKPLGSGGRARRGGGSVGFAQTGDVCLSSGGEAPACEDAYVDECDEVVGDLHEGASPCASFAFAESGAPDDDVFGLSCGYLVEGVCRNRFWEGSELEVLSPGQPVRTLRVKGLKHLPEEGRPYNVDIANRAMERYSFVAPFPLLEHDIARIERAERTTKPVE